MGGKVVVAIMHAILFVIIVSLLNVTEGFQQITTKVGAVKTPEQLLRQAESNLKYRVNAVEMYTKKISELTEQLSSVDRDLATTQNELVAAQEAFKSAETIVSKKNDELSDAKKTALDTKLKMDMLTTKITVTTKGTKGMKGANQLKNGISHYKSAIASATKNMEKDREAINSAKMAIAARDNVQKVVAQDATLTSTGAAGSTQEMITEVTKVAREMQVVADKQLAVSDAAGSASVTTGTGILNMLGLGTNASMGSLA